MAALEISSSTAHTIIETRKPIGVFYCEEDNKIIGIDNSTGDAWCEEFDSKQNCLNWLKGVNSNGKK